MFKGVPTHVRQLRVSIDGTAASGKPFLYNSSTCGPMSINAQLGSHDAAVTSSTIPYQATDCPTRSFGPAMSFTAYGGSETVAPEWNIKLSLNGGDSAMKSTKVLLPSIMTVNVQGLGQVCEAAEAAAWSCPAASLVGEVSVTTPLLPAPVVGKVYVARGQTTLPDLMILIGAPVNLQIRGTNRFVNGTQIESSFDNLPDLLWSELDMKIYGGPKGILGVRGNGECGDAPTSFSSHSGQGITAMSKIYGLFACERNSAICGKPTVVATSKGVRKKGNKKQRFSVSFALPSRCAKIKSFSVLLPKGTKLNKKLLKYKKKNKRLRRNLRNVTGKAGGKSLRVTDFAAAGKNGLKIKTAIPAGTTSISFRSARSAIVLPLKTFCGAVKGKGKTKKARIKKCKKKQVAFTFVVTRDDGSVLRYVYKVKAGDRKFK